MSQQSALQQPMIQQLALPLIIPQRQTIGNFIRGMANGEALSWLDLWPNWPIPHVAIHGQSGCGKTHLGRSFSQHVHGHYISAAETDSQNPDTLFCHDPSVLIIDDYDLIQQEDWLFHVYNMAKEHNTPVIYLGKIAPAQKSFGLADLQSRLRSIHSIEIQAPDEHLFRELLRAKITALGMPCPEEITAYLFRRSERSYKAIHDLIDRIDCLTLEQQRPLTLPLLREIMGESSHQD